MIVYRYGAFETPSGVNTAIHVSPSCRDIARDGGIIPRSFRKSKMEGLGGSHDISVSAYANSEDALNTLFYMWRIWQVAKGILGIAEVLQLDPSFDPKDLDLVFNKMNYRPNEIVMALCGHTICSNPIVFSSEWAHSIQEDDLCGIEFIIEETKLFTGHVRSVLDIKNLPFDRNSGFCSAVTNYIRNSRFIDGYSVLDFYSLIKNNIKDGVDTIDPYLLEYSFSRQPRSYDERLDAARHSFFGMDRWGIRSDPFLMKHAIAFLEKDPVVFLFENFLIDFRPREFTINDCYEYYPNEAEFRFFKTIDTDRLTRIYTIDDALKIATERNGGREPLFFPMKPITSDFVTERY